MSDDDEIEIRLETNKEQTEISLVLTSKTPIDMSDLILGLEQYLTELTRAESDLRKPGVELH